jgi:hypothetical protein
MKKLCGSLLAFVLLVGGCTTKSKADAKARAAYMAGQQQALMRVYDSQRTSIRFVGNVKNPLVEWTEGLTLALAVVAAEYQGVVDPRDIVVVRNGQPIRVDPKQLLRGEDFLLQPGDAVEIHP